jgi:hypothetical protein
LPTNPLAQPLDDSCVGHAAALAHRLQRVAATPLFERIDHGGHDAGTAGALRVSDGDRATVDIGLGQAGPGVFGPGQCRLKGA